MAKAKSQAAAGEVQAHASAPSNPAPKLVLQPVDFSNSFEEVVVRLVRAIRLGAVPIGERFPSERELSEMLGVSRATVREAMRGLQHAGYVEVRRGRGGGAFVARDSAMLSSEDRKRALGPQLLEALDCRLAVEPGVAGLAAHKRDGDQVRQIRSFIAEMEDVKDSRDFIRRNCRLHILFAEATVCPPLVKAVTSAELEVMDAFLALPDLEPRETRSHFQHRRIIDAIAKGNRAAARAAMETHLVGTDKLMRELAAPVARSS